MSHGALVPKPAPIAEQLAVADVEKGRIFFGKNCDGCHNAATRWLRSGHSASGRYVSGLCTIRRLRASSIFLGDPRSANDAGQMAPQLKLIYAFPQHGVSSVSHGKVPTITNVSKLSIRETVRIAKEVQAKGTEPVILDGQGKVMDLYFLERALGDDWVVGQFD